MVLERYVKIMEEANAVTALNGAITLSATSDAGAAVILTDIAHGLSIGDVITISASVGADDHDGIWSVTAVSADTFTIRDAWTTNAYTGTWERNGYGSGVGKAGEITAVADLVTGVTVTVTDVAHGLTIGESVIIVGTTDYNGTFKVLDVPDADSFTISETYTSSQKGAWYGAPTAIMCGSFSDPVDRQIMYEDRTDLQSTGPGYGGPVKYSGSLEATLRPTQIEPILNALWGAKAYGYTPNTTTFSLDAPESLVMVIAEETNTATDLDVAARYDGVGISSFTLTAEAKEFVKWTCDWMAKARTAIAFVAPTGGDDYHAETPLVWNNGTVSVDGVGTAQLTAIDLTIDGTLRDDWYTLGSATLHGLVRNGVVDISGTMTFTEREYAELVRCIYGSVFVDATTPSVLPVTNLVDEVAVVITLKDASDSTSRVVVTLGNVVYESVEHSISGRDEITKTISFKATGDSNTWITTEA